MSIEIVVENVRRIERAALELAPGSRTVLVGRNNSGKTTILEMAARALWSLPGPYPHSGWREFNTSYYRRTGDVYQRPRVTVTMPLATLGDDLGHAADTLVVFEEWANVLEARVRADNHLATQLLTAKIELVLGARRCHLVRVDGAGAEDLWSAEPMHICAALLDEAQWAPFNLDAPPNLHPNHRAGALYQANTRFSRASAAFARRVLYVPVGRQPGFGAQAALLELTQAEMQTVTGLLLRLKAVHSPAFEGLSGSLSLLFPETRRLTLAEHGGTVVPQVEFTDGRTEHVGNLGFGFQNALHLLTVVSMTPANGILLIDEPEKGLNQSCQRDLAILLEALRPDLTLLVATQAEAFCRGLSTSSKVQLIEAEGNTARATPLNIVESPEDVRRLARAMGLDPLYLGEGGRIIYVEGVSDQLIVERWLRIHFPHAAGVQVVALGGCGKISEEFVKPLLIAFKEHVFLLLDSDRPAQAEPRSAAIDRLVRWLEQNDIANHYVLEKREVENYLGPDAIAAAAEIHPGVLRSAPGHEDWFDIKAAFSNHKGYRYDERRLSVGAFDLLSAEQRSNLFQGENAAILGMLRRFLQLE